jgi:large subunit ribosomal protein L19e
MDLKTQKRLAAELLKCSADRVQFDPARLHDIKEGITKSDMRLLISDGLVTAKPIKGTSRVRARKTQEQKRKGLRRGPGSKKGTANANENKKEKWMAKVRAQRAFLQELKEKKLIANATFRELYLKSKGGFFRSKRHIKLFIDDKRLWQTEKTE